MTNKLIFNIKTGVTKIVSNYTELSEEEILLHNSFLKELKQGNDYKTVQQNTLRKLVSESTTETKNIKAIGNIVLTILKQNMKTYLI